MAKFAQVGYKAAMSLAKQLRIYHRVQFAARRMQKAADRALLAAASITTAQAAVLTVVGQGTAVSQRDVAKQLGLNESAIAGMTSRLLDMELLARGDHDDDTRAWRLSLTKKGRTAVKKMEKPFATVNATIESALDNREMNLLAEHLSKLGDAFGVN